MVLLMSDSVHIANDPPKLSTQYELDASNRIAAISDGWDEFATANGGQLTLAADVLGQEIWGFIAGETPRTIFRAIYQTVREQNAEFRLEFRCDAPEVRRYMEMVVEPLSEQWLRVSNWTLRLEPREPVSLPVPAHAPREQFVVICSNCNKIQVNGYLWLELEEALGRVDEFFYDTSIGISHGYCRDCYKLLLSRLDDMSQ